MNTWKLAGFIFVCACLGSLLTGGLEALGSMLLVFAFVGVVAFFID